MLTIDPVQIEKVVSSPSDANGSYRKVWFFGDIVIKREVDDSGANADEYNFYQDFGGAFFSFEGEDWEVVLPKTTMINGYIIMEMVKYPHISIDGPDGCDFCRLTKYVYTYKDMNGASHPRTFERHDPRCPGIEFILALEECMEWQGVYDVHEGNFMVDIDNNRVIFVDFAE